MDLINRKIPEFQTPYRLSSYPLTSRVEENSGEIVTVPDEAISVRDLLVRYSTGIAPAISRQTYYDSDTGDVGFDDIDPTDSPDFDLADVTALGEEILINNKVRNVTTINDDATKPDTEKKSPLKSDETVVDSTSS